MALTTAQLVTIAEITQETDETIIALYDSLDLSTERETVLIADTVTWNLNRDDVDVWLQNGAGVNWQAQRLLNAIRERTRKTFGLSLVSYEVSGYSQSIPNVWIY